MKAAYYFVLFVAFSQIDCSFPLVARIFIEKTKSEKIAYHFSLHFRNFQYIIAVNLERKIDKQDQLKIYINLPKRALEP